VSISTDYRSSSPLLFSPPLSRPFGPLRSNVPLRRRFLARSPLSSRDRGSHLVRVRVRRGPRQRGTLASNFPRRSRNLVIGRRDVRARRTRRSAPDRTTPKRSRRSTWLTCSHARNCARSNRRCGARPPIWLRSDGSCGPRGRTMGRF